MKKKTALALAIILIASASGGCWSYRSLSDISIISSMAIDINSAGGYDVTFEIADMSGQVKQQGVKSYLIESQGATIHDAVMSAQKRNMNDLYFGHMQAVIISEDAARSRNISGLIDWFIRDLEIRETLSFVISAGKARDLISIKPIGTPLLGVEIMKILENDRRFALAVPFVELYNLYDTINSEGISPVLPVYRIAENEGKQVVEAYGAAVFRGQRMVGTLSPEETKFGLFIRGKVKGGLLTFPSSGAADDTSVIVLKNDTAKSFSYADGKLRVNIKITVTGALTEDPGATGENSEERTNRLEKSAAEYLARRIGGVIKKVQTEYGSDIFGFGDVIHKQDPALWKQLKENWDETFASIGADIQCSVKLIGSSVVKE